MLVVYGFLNVCISLLVSACIFCVFLGGMCSDVRSTSSESLISLSLSLHPLIRALCLCKTKPIPGRASSTWGHIWGMLPSMLYSTPCASKCGGLVGGIHFCHHRCWMGSSNHTSSVKINGLPVGIISPQWAVSFWTHCVDSVVSN